MRDHINFNIKSREWCRPLTPVIHKNAVSEYFINYGDAPWMQFVWPEREKYRAIIPSVTHIDGSARVQTVSQEENARLYLLIEKFADITNIPILMNTSFNIKGQPIVETPGEAIQAFKESPIDVLVIGDFIIEK
jgi:carbamoyltransferase